MSNILKGTSILTLGDIVSRGVEVFRIVFITHMFSVGEFGIYSLAAATAIIFANFVLPSYSTVVLKFFPYYEKKGRQKMAEFFTASNLWFLINGLLVIFVIIAGANFIGLYYQKPEVVALIKLAAPLAALSSFAMVLNTFLMAKEKFKWVFIQQFSGVSVNLVSVVLFTYAGWGLNGLVLSYVLSEATRTLIPLIPLARYITWPTFKLDKEIWKFWNPLLTTSFFKTATNNLPTIIIGRLLDNYFIGLYNIVDRTVKLLLAFFDPYLSTVMAMAVRAFTKSEKDFWGIINQHNRFTAFILVCIAGGAAIILGPIVFYVLYGNEFMAAIPYYYVYTVFGVFGTMGITFPRAIYSVYNKNSYYLYFNVLATLFLVAIMIPLIYWHGLWGLIISMVISRIFNLAVQTYYAHKAGPALNIGVVWKPLFLYVVLFAVGFGASLYLNIPVVFNAIFLTGVFVLVSHISGFLKLPVLVKGLFQEFKQINI